MNNASLELGGTNWAEKDGNILGYSVGDTSGKYSPQEFTFARGSNLSATRIDKAGLIVKGRENVLLQSNNFSNASWVLNGATLTSGQSGYDGSSNAWSLTSTTLNGSHRIIQTFTGVSNSIVTYSVFAKSNGYNFLRIVENASTGDFATFNLSNGSVANNTGIANTAIIASVGNGWYRCSVSVDGGNVTRFDIYTMETVGATSFLGDGVSGAYIQDAQVELGLAASSYIPTTTTTAQAGVLENTPRLNYTTGVANPYLLLEPSRTNLMVQSEAFSTSTWTLSNSSVTANNTTSPEGLVNAYKLTENTANSSHRITQTSPTSSGQVYTQSIFAKDDGSGRFLRMFRGSGTYNVAVFNLTNGVIYGQSGSNLISADIVPYTNGWYKCSITFTTQFSNIASYIALQNGSSDSYTGDGTSGIYIYGASLELGSYPTSYIPTYSVSATRASDSCSKTGISSLIGGTSGTIFFDVVMNESLTNTNYKQFFYYTDSSANQTYMFVSAANYIVGNPNLGNITSSTQLQAGERYKIAVTYATNSFKMYVNGSQDATSSSGTPIDNENILSIGSYSGSSEFNEFGFKQYAHFKEVLSDAQLATLTTI